MADSAPPPRVQMACANCRKSKIKCMTQSTTEPCMNCQKRGWQCEYLPMKETPGSRTHVERPPRHRPGAETMTFPAGTFTDIHLVDPYAQSRPASRAQAGPSGSSSQPTAETLYRPHNVRPSAPGPGFVPQYGPSSGYAPPSIPGYPGQPTGVGAPGFYPPPIPGYPAQASTGICQCPQNGPCFCGWRGY
ncbi:Zn(2)-C6 fungal-type domain-containing protein [Mycena chlorophos]|uniref:Zn(2)-C6 fungal-type domain-containing protein n=1 Tax=Mycena chlorophos TaxID=658473 RepID=A0A8H6TKP9_MYCCL|nr:Zn(2)-C6 fungal-type domain-containing protein [Mycena chlorophos]